MSEWNMDKETNKDLAILLRRTDFLVCEKAKQAARDEAIARILEYVEVRKDKKK